VRAIPHLRIEMWGTHIRAALREVGWGLRDPTLQSLQRPKDGSTAGLLKLELGPKLNLARGCRGRGNHAGGG
jgi:hypothetical protein